VSSIGITLRKADSDWYRGAGWCSISLQKRGRLRTLLVKDMSAVRSGDCEGKTQEEGRSSYSDEPHVDVFQEEGLEWFLKASELWLLIVRPRLLYLYFGEVYGILMIMIIFVEASMGMELVHLVCYEKSSTQMTFVRCDPWRTEV